MAQAARGCPEGKLLHSAIESSQTLPVFGFLCAAVPRPRATLLAAGGGLGPEGGGVEVSQAGAPAPPLPARGLQEQRPARVEEAP